jgi:hypothetical protein
MLSVRRPGDDTDGGDGERYYSYAYAYGPAGLAGLRANTYALGCAVFASIGGLTFGYDQGVIANVLVMQDFVARWPVGAWERGLMSAPHFPIPIFFCSRMTTWYGH